MAIVPGAACAQGTGRPARLPYSRLGDCRSRRGSL